MNFFTSPFFWLSIAVVFIIVEMLEEPFGLLFFGIGALFAALLALFTRTQSFLLLFTVFIVGAFTGLFFFRASYLALFKKRLVPTNVSALVGQKGLVTEEIPGGGNRGNVRIGEESWKARSIDENSISPGVYVKIISIAGNTVTVEKIKEE